MSAATALALAWFAAIVVAAGGPRVPLVSARPGTDRRWWPRWRARARDQQVHAARHNELPDVVDLFVLAVGAGCNVPLALAAAAGRAPPSWRAGLVAAQSALDRGERIGDVLDGLVITFGEPARPLATALASSVHYGTPLLPALERIAVDARRVRQRRAEEAARRLPVALLFPLVLCILPAFALLSLAPALAGGLQLLRR